MPDFDTIILPVYIINLKERPERLAYVLKQFEDKPEFEVNIVEAIKHKIGAVGLWQSILKVINLAIQNDDDVIIICEDDHTFTEHYERDFFIQNILEAHKQECDVLNGGIGNFNHAVPITRNRFWVNSFCSTQFIVVYRKFFEAILIEDFADTDVADLKISEMTSHKMVLYPFISKQHDFGYSDVTAVHNEYIGLVDDMFKRSSNRLAIYQKVYDEYLVKSSDF